MRRGRNLINSGGYTYFVTTTVNNFINIFSEEKRLYDVLIDNLKYYINKYESSLIGYVLMPNHIHLLLFLPEGKSISDFMRDYKKYTSIQIKDILMIDKSHKKNLLFNEKSNFKLWMDRFDAMAIDKLSIIETKLNYMHYNPVKAGLVNEMTDWKYSSARNYYLNDHSVIEVSTDWKI